MKARDFNSTWVDKQYVEVLLQLFTIALPQRAFGNEPACPYMAKGLATGKVTVNKGLDPVTDVDRAVETFYYGPIIGPYMPSAWAGVYWYPEDMNYKNLQLTCRIMSNEKVNCVYLHKEAEKPAWVKLAGRYPILIVENSPIVNDPRISWDLDT